MNLSAPYPTQKPAVLIVDHDQAAMAALQSVLKQRFDVFTAVNRQEAEDVLRYEYVQIILCSESLANDAGVAFLVHLREVWPTVIRLLMLNDLSVSQLTDEHDQAGIFQYIEKPWQAERVLATLKTAVDFFELQRQNHLLAVELKVASHAITTPKQTARTPTPITIRRDHCAEIVRSPNGMMDQVLTKVCQVARFDFPILITGKSGTGKELIAKAIHDHSSRAERPFIAENCGALPDQLLESELFGYKKGAFTGAYMDHIGLLEQASGGTLFLDEIGEISPAFQVKLLRVLQEQEIRPLGQAQARKIDVRVLCATNRDLEDEVKAGRFREDLFYRLAGYVIHLPELADRPEDIALIAQRILAQMCQQYQRVNLGFEPQAMAMILQYRWPGNVRELQNEIARMFMLTPADQPLKAEFLSAKILLSVPTARDRDVLSGSVGKASLKDRVSLLEKQIIKEALTRLGWNRTNVAIELGLSRLGLRKKMIRYGFEDDVLGVEEWVAGDLAQ